VMASENKPAAGLQILLASEGRGQDRRVVTDGRGMYAITGLPSGEYVVRVTDFGRREQGGAPMPLETAPAYKVNVAEGEVTVLDIQLQP
jgi:Carboxypeptidase regulatory-like domain